MEQIDHTHRILASAAQTGGVFGVVACTLPPFSPGPQPHAHPAHLEGCVVVEGVVAITHGDETLTLTAGQMQLLLPGRPHHCWNPSPTPARLLLIYTPGADIDGLLRLARGEPSREAGVDGLEAANHS